MNTNLDHVLWEQAPAAVYCSLQLTKSKHISDVKKSKKFNGILTN